MVWQRLPTFLANIRLQLMPLGKEQLEQIQRTGWVKEAVFKTTPNVTKTEVKAFLESVYGMRVQQVNTINYEGKKKRHITPDMKPHYYRRPDWKKVYVIFQDPPQPKQRKQQKQQQSLLSAAAQPLQQAQQQ